jgi:FMN-dependent NADH-azoreductase
MHPTDPTARNLLWIDSSARPGRSGREPRGSHTRRLTARFIESWQAARPQDAIIYRDVGAHPPAPVTGDWVAAAFTKPDRRDAAQRGVLAESDELTAELIAADLIVIGAPMYNFGIPAPLKAWIDNVVRVGVTFGFDRARGDVPYWPMLTGGRQLVILGARGDYGYDPGERLAGINLVETSLTIPLGYIGIDRHEAVAIEYDEFGDDRLAASIASAEARTAALADRLATEASATAQAA